MSDQQSSYRQIIKATSLFGGVQVFNIIIKILRSKIIAVLLGPSGIGFLGLLNSTTAIISGLTNFGLGTSAVKDIAAANSSDNNNRISIIIIVFQRLVWFTGIFGTLVMIVSSSWLSQFVFGNTEYTVAFLWISVTLLFTQLSSGQMVILQGMRKLQNLAKANLLGSTLGLLVTFPLYYYWRIDGIVPGIICTSLVSLLVSWIYSRKITYDPVEVTYKQTLVEGKNMLHMGFMISISVLLGIGVSYIIRIFINRTGGINQVGLYNAGFAIISTYVGMIFSAMGTDYYPRLSTVANDNKLCKQTINQQAEITILILAPVLLIFLIFINFVIITLYSQQFIGVNGLIYWAALGMFFRAPSWAISFLFLAKGASKLFFWNELFANIYSVGLSILGYTMWGLTGLGVAFGVTYFLYLIQVFFVGKIKFEFAFSHVFIKIFLIQFLMALAAFLVMQFLNKPFTYYIGIILIGISSWYSLKELNKRLEFKSLFNRRRHK